ncbi:MAG: J domain-containing protein [Acaryochloris sp. RU_4_1]|nr:J domain-containing protein [Acaryochloris sp. SU_5_25]NJM65545.1 J domain-containing protein [Acaryochloris sp. RU_4_1]NJR54393.1 J domain-containing protein [Acaryochloris sp. CRU_2_0]
MPTDLNYYQLLDLTSDASSDQIHRAYRQKSKIYHPDTTKLAKGIATQQFQLLNEAYGTLSSPERKKLYDVQLRLSTPQSYPRPHLQRPNVTPSIPSIDIQERPLSAGELFALFILGLTFLGCLVLALIIGCTRGEVILQNFPTLSGKINPAFNQEIQEAPPTAPTTMPKFKQKTMGTSISKTPAHSV